MPKLNILDADTREKILKEIQGEENKRRKDEALRRFEIYKKNQKQFILQALVNEFSVKTVSEMRTMTSINLCEKIIDEKASIYKETPDRKFVNEKNELAEQEKEQVEKLYELGQIDVSFKKANKYYKLNNDQIHMQVIPIDGVIKARVLLPYQIDAIVDPLNPEKAYGYITSVYDKSRVIKSVPTDLQGNQFGQSSDQINQGIGDQDDYRDLMDQRYIWWTDEYNFMTDGRGAILDDNGDPVQTIDQTKIVNPIQKKPFVEIAYSKDVEYWNRGGCNAVDFAIDFGVVMSDTVNINRLQGYAQGVIYAKEAPHKINVGPNQVMHIPLDPKSEIQPRFEFVSPNPDLNASLALLDVAVNFFLTSESVETSAISGKAEGGKYTSAADRLLAMLDKFEASQDDKDAFKIAECKVFELIKDWSNAFQGTNKPTGEIKPLVPELQLAKIPEKAYLEVNYKKPSAVLTQTDLEDSVIKRLEAGLITKVEAIMELRGIGEDAAELVLEKLDQETQDLFNNDNNVGDNGDGNQQNDQNQNGVMNGRKAGSFRNQTQ